MTMRDTAIIAYAETKIVAKGDKDVWTLGAEVLEDLIRTTGVDKAEIDGLILSSSQTGAGNPFWAQTTADQLALEVDFCKHRRYRRLFSSRRRCACGDRNRRGALRDRLLSICRHSKPREQLASATLPG